MPKPESSSPDPGLQSVPAGVKSYNNKGPTPMMAQYLAIKTRHTDYLLFYRMGDFYELFFDDAVQASAALDIALTKRGKHLGEEIPMCGVPVHNHETYLSRLIKRGFKVAVCEQMEDSSDTRKRGSKALVRREVIRIITPGTLTEESLLDSRRNNFLAALAEVNNRFGLAWLDLSTGEFHLQSVPDSRLSAVLGRIDPEEILISDNLLLNKTLEDLLEPWREMLTPSPVSLFDSTTGKQRLKNCFDTTTSLSLNRFSNEECSAGGALVDYLELTQKGRLPHLDPPRRFEEDSVMAIDQATRRNLELTVSLAGERQGSLLSAIDHTKTSFGARMLAARLAAPLREPKEINQRLDGIQFFLEDRSLRNALRDILKLCPDLERARSRLSIGRGGPRDLAAIRDGLFLGTEIKILLNDASSLSWVDGNFSYLGKNKKLRDMLSVALAENPPISSRDGGFIAMGYSTKLDELKTLRDQSRKLVLKLQEKYINHTKIKNLKIKHNNMLGYFIEVTTRHADSLRSCVDSQYIHRQTTKNAARFTTVELGSLESQIISSVDKALTLELEIFENLVAEINSQAEDIARIALSLATLDVASALAELATTENYCRPIVDNSNNFLIKGGRHPVVELASINNSGNLPASRFVPNNCSLTSDARLWLLTGPNMAGKSTFLRQNALISILAQSGSFVPAEEAHIGQIDRVFSRVGASDDLAHGRSTFMVEMLETAAILSQATERSFVILDEIGRGTATFDGLSIAWAVIEHLHEINQCRGLFATHYHELTSLTTKLKNLSCHTMCVKEWKGDVIFLHEVAAGSADRSYGIHVGQLAGLPHNVIKRARDVLANLESKNQSHNVASIAKDLPLFRTSGENLIDDKPSPVDKLLNQVTPDELSPREALEIIYKLKNLAEDP